MTSVLIGIAMFAMGPCVPDGNDTLLLADSSHQQQDKNFTPAHSGDLQLLRSHTPANPYPARKKPSFLLVGKKKWIQYNPVNLAFGGMLYIYQSVISSQISADCPYEISCSAFSKQAILEYGLIKGLPLSADRITRCTKFSAKDLHPLRFNEKGMIIDPPSYYCKKHRH